MKIERLQTIVMCPRLNFVTVKVSTEALAAKYPYERAYLPVARLGDGAMWIW